MTNEQAERFLGTLIRLLNPYTKTMYYPPNKPQAGFEAETEEARKALEELRRKGLEEARIALGEAVNKAKAEEARMAPRDDVAQEARKVLEEAQRALADAREVLHEFQLEVDNRYGSQNGGNYLSWEFKGQPQTVKKAVRIEFRHPVGEGVWITDHLLVGYAGSNGPG
jgi:hypothetical protein